MEAAEARDVAIQRRVGHVAREQKRAIDMNDGAEKRSRRVERTAGRY